MKRVLGAVLLVLGNGLAAFGLGVTVTQPSPEVAPGLGVAAMLITAGILLRQGEKR